MRIGRLILPMMTTLVISCTSSPNRQTLSQLHTVEADVEEVHVADSLDRAMDSYRRFLEETPRTAMTPEAMRRLADLQIEKQYGIIGDGELVELPAPPESSRQALQTVGSSRELTEVPGIPGLSESDEEFESRTTEAFVFGEFDSAFDLGLPAAEAGPDPSGPAEAIEIYQRILTEYPRYERNDQVLYQMARAYDEIGETEKAMEVMDRVIGEYGYSRYIDEVQFRRGEFYFTRRQFRDAENAYMAIVAMGSNSSFYELALYKLGWALYKQEFYEEALHNFIALLDYKTSIGYDFDQEHTEEEERRVEDTFRVISLSFSNLGGPEVLNEYFTSYGNRNYEDRIYANLGEFYLGKLRYNDAASVYESFVELYPFHRVAPHFSMRVVEIYGEGNFPLLVVESKRDFATRYGLQSEYWHHFDIAESPDVLDYLKTNIQDLANHYHALYQAEDLEEEQPQNFVEASRWYREFLASFPQDEASPPMNYQLANLLLENEDLGDAASEYERTAYDYPLHEQSSAAGYAAIYAHREHLKVVGPEQELGVMNATVASSLRFADTFPEHEHAPVVLGAAAEDLYELGNFDLAIVSGRKLIERYPAAELPLRHSAWTVVAHSSMEVEAFSEAELAYMRVLELTPEDDETRQSFIDNLAASIYKQGEQANLAEDYRAAANHFLRIKEVAPTSEIRAAAEYDAAAALVRLEDWTMAAEVFEAFRDTYPDHELSGETTKQLAFVYRQGGDLARSAGEYERMAAESDDPELQRGAMLEAGELYEEASSLDNALAVYLRYIEAFPDPLDIAQETRFKVAGMYEDRGDHALYHEQLESIVAVDKSAGAARTDRSRFLAAQSALVLSGRVYDEFVAVQLVQPFEQSLAEKQERMNIAMAAFEDLVTYEVGEVTAAATYHIAEVYFEFSRALLESERPTDLSAAELADYELVIEEEAFPFEEQAIEVHEANFELMAGGIYNEWIQKSLARLAVLMPGRYAKSEISSGFIDSIDTYAYRSPNAPAIGIDGEIQDPDRSEPTANRDQQDRERLPSEAEEGTVRAELSNARVD